MAKETNLKISSEYDLNNPAFIQVENRPVQYFNQDYIDQCRKMSLEEIVEKISDQQRLFWNLHNNKMSENSVSISLKIPQNVLQKHKALCKAKGLKYQTQINKLILNWIISES